MPQCTMCKKWFHPDYSVLVDNENKIYKCTFCYLGKDVLTIEDEKGKVIEVVSKRDASESYLKFMRKLKDQPKVKQLVNPES